MPHSKSVLNGFILASILSVLFIGFWLRSSGLEYYPPGISNDEAKNLIDATYMKQTLRTPFYEDEGRPEPLNRLVATGGAMLYGNSVWAFRLTSAFWGVLTLAVSYWTAVQCFHETSPHTRKIIGLFAMIALTIALGHITVTRSLYRAVPLPLFILLTIGFTARGLRTYKWHNFIAIGVFIALGIYTYTAGFVVPIAFVPVGLILIITQRQRITHWMPRLILTSVVLALITSPVIYLLLTQPSAVLARASDVSQASDSDLSKKLIVMIGQFFTEGDENPQYNVANAPLIAQMLIPFFFVGLGTLALRLRQPAAVLIGSLLILNIIPVILTDEITHGLRVYSEFAIIPLVIGASIIPILSLTERLTQSRAPYYLVLVAILSIAGYQVVQSHQTYVNFWDNADTQWRRWIIYDKELTHNEWFFRSDRKTLTDWIKSQDTPLLIPAEELYKDAQRGMLMSHYATVDAVDDTFQLPANTQLVIPWSLEHGDFLTHTPHFALLKSGTIYLLPPLTTASHTALLQHLDTATNITFESDQIPIVAKTFSPPTDITLNYQHTNAEANPLARFNDELDIISWYGIDDISKSGKQTYTLNWSVNRPVTHEYGAFLQILTQDWERITGQDKFILRWLYPTIAWHPEQVIPDTFTLDIPEGLPVGAYRLVAGAWYVNGGDMPAQSFYGEATDNIATIGWLKVPQANIPQIPADAIPIDATFDQQFQLISANIQPTSDDQMTVTLYWKSLVNRPQLDATVFVHLLDADHTIVSQSDIRPMNGQYPTFIWDEDETVSTEHTLTLQNNDNLELVVGMYTQPDFARLPVTQNGYTLTDNVAEIINWSNLLTN